MLARTVPQQYVVTALEAAQNRKPQCCAVDTRGIRLGLHHFLLRPRGPICRDVADVGL